MTPSILFRRQPYCVAREFFVKAALWTACLFLCGTGMLTAQTYSILRSFGAGTNVTGWTPTACLVQGADGMLYGTTSAGQGTVAGTVFKVNTDGSGFQALKWFTNTLEGASPQCTLVSQGTTLFGTTSSGGNSGCGTIFKINNDGSGYTVLKHFGGADGKNPVAGLILDGSTLFGTTQLGGISNAGTIFRIGTDGAGFAVLKEFLISDGRSPFATVTASGGRLYGTTSAGGPNTRGTIYSLNENGTDFTTIYAFSGGDGRNCRSKLLVSGGQLFGTTSFGGYAYPNPASEGGTVFSLNTDGGNFVLLYQFNLSDGKTPASELCLSGSTLYGVTSAGGSAGGGVVFSLDTSGSGFTVLRNLTAADGTGATGGLLSVGNTLYGLAAAGGTSGNGTIFSIGNDGNNFALLSSMSEADGTVPRGAMLLSGNTLYGTTSTGGKYGKGTLFSLNTDGSGYSVLLSFISTNGETPVADMLLANGMLYGTTYGGGSGGVGLVFNINTNGNGFTVLKNLGSTAGGNPRAGLVLSDGFLYGTAEGSGSGNAGTLFKLSTNGDSFTVLKNFNTADGAYPHGGVVISGNWIYGMTIGGGTHNWGTMYRIAKEGTGYTVLRNNTDSGLNSPLVLSGNCIYATDYGARLVQRVNLDGTGLTNLCFLGFRLGGVAGEGGLALSTDTLFGTSDIFGDFDGGTLYSVKTNGADFTILKSFAGPDGATPASRVCVSDTTVYGTTAGGGAVGLGVIFRFVPAVHVDVAKSGGNIVLSWPASPGSTYQVQSRTAADRGAWNNIGTPLTATTNFVQANFPASPNQQSFYRVLSQ